MLKRLKIVPNGRFTEIPLDCLFYVTSYLRREIDANSMIRLNKYLNNVLTSENVHVNDRFENVVFTASLKKHPKIEGIVYNYVKNLRQLSTKRNGSDLVSDEDRFKYKVFLIKINEHFPRLKRFFDNTLLYVKESVAVHNVMVSSTQMYFLDNFIHFSLYRSLGRLKNLEHIVMPFGYYTNKEVVQDIKEIMSFQSGKRRIKFTIPYFKNTTVLMAIGFKGFDKIFHGRSFDFSDTTSESDERFNGYKHPFDLEIISGKLFKYDKYDVTNRYFFEDGILDKKLLENHKYVKPNNFIEKNKYWCGVLFDNSNISVLVNFCQLCNSLVTLSEHENALKNQYRVFMKGDRFGNRTSMVTFTYKCENCSECSLCKENNKVFNHDINKCSICCKSCCSNCIYKRKKKNGSERIICSVCIKKNVLGCPSCKNNYERDEENKVRVKCVSCGYKFKEVCSKCCITDLKRAGCFIRFSKLGSIKRFCKKCFEIEKERCVLIDKEIQPHKNAFNDAFGFVEGDNDNIDIDF